MRHQVGIGLFLYFLTLAVYRYDVRGVAGLYDLMWLCNMTLLFSSLCCLFNWGEGLAIACGAVAFSHVSWNLDIVFHFLFGFMPFGTASYVLWPQTSKWEIVTTLHHVWMIPLLMVLLRRNYGIKIRWIHGIKGMVLPGNLTKKYNPLHSLIYCFLGVLVPLSYYLTPKVRQIRDKLATSF